MVQTAQAGTTGVFELSLIKTPHYDDEGYVIQWVRSSIQANSLATLNGLALELFNATAGARAAADKQRRRKAALAAEET